MFVGAISGRRLLCEGHFSKSKKNNREKSVTDTNNDLAEHLHAAVEKFRKKRVPVEVTIQDVMDSAVELAGSAINNLPPHVRPLGLMAFMKDLMEIVEEYAEEEGEDLCPAEDA